MKFTDLEFKPHPFSKKNGMQAKAFFPNGFGISVIKTEFSYGREEGLYEAAILVGDALDDKITYESGITDDVLGYQSVDDINDLLIQVEALEPVKEIQDE